MNSRIGARVLVITLSMAFLAGALSVSAPNAKASWVFGWDDETALGAPAAQSVVVSDPDGLVYVMGGVTDGSYNAVASSYSYDSGTGDWTVLASMLTPERGAAGAMGSDGRVYVFGGDSGPGYTQIYNPTSNSWSLGAAMLYGVWEGKAATVSDGTIWVVGGEGAPSAGYVQIYDPETDSWSAGPAAPAAVLCGALISDGDDLYYSGGGDGGYSGTTNFFKYDAAEDEWTALADLPVARAGHAMVMGVDGLIYLIGGSDNGYNFGLGMTYSSVVAYDPEADEWSTVVSMDYSRTYLGAIVTAEGRIFAMGGNTATTILSVAESLQLYLFEYSIEASANSVRAGESVLVVLNAEYTYIEEYSNEVYWYLVSDADGTVYNPDGIWSSTDAALGVTIDIPTAIPAGDYTIVIDYWIAYADGVYEVVEMEELPLEVLPAIATTDELLAEIAALQAELEALNASQADKIAELTEEIAGLKQQLAAQDEDIGTLGDKADSANLWAMLTMILVVVVLVLLLLMFLMGRKKA